MAQVDSGSAAAGPGASAAASAPAVPGEPVSVAMEEKVIVILGKNGGLENMEVQGVMTLQVWAS